MRKSRKGDKIEREFKDHRHDYLKLFTAAANARIARRRNGVGRPPKVNFARGVCLATILWWEV